MSETFTFTFSPALEGTILDFCDRKGIVFEVEKTDIRYVDGYDYNRLLEIKLSSLADATMLKIAFSEAFAKGAEIAEHFRREVLDLTHIDDDSYDEHDRAVQAAFAAGRNPTIALYRPGIQTRVTVGGVDTCSGYLDCITTDEGTVKFNVWLGE